MDAAPIDRTVAWSRTARAARSISNGSCTRVAGRIGGPDLDPTADTALSELGAASGGGDVSDSVSINQHSERIAMNYDTSTDQAAAEYRGGEI